MPKLAGSWPRPRDGDAPVTLPVFPPIPALLGLKQAVMEGGQWHCRGLQSPVPGSEKGKPMMLAVGSYSPQNEGLFLLPVLPSEPEWP